MNITHSFDREANSNGAIVISNRKLVITTSLRQIVIEKFIITELLPWLKGLIEIRENPDRKQTTISFDAETMLPGIPRLIYELYNYEYGGDSWRRWE